MGRKPLKKTLVSALALGGMLGCALALAAPSGQRPLRFDDLYREEHMLYKNEWSIARDGALAFVVKRPAGTGKHWRVKGADVWVQMSPDEAPINLTEGSKDS